MTRPLQPSRELSITTGEDKAGTSMETNVMRSSTAPSRAMRVLVIDDDEMVIDALKAILQRAGCSVVGISDSVEGLVAAVETGFDVAVVDINMPNVTGMELLKEVKAKRPETEVVMMTAFATVKTAVEAVKAGAYHYLTKPFESVDEVRLTIQKAFEHKLLLERNRQLEGMLVEQERFEGLVGRGPKMEAVFRLIGAVAPSSLDGLTCPPAAS